jgi:hypothetical protein
VVGGFSFATSRRGVFSAGEPPGAAGNSGDSGGVPGGALAALDPATAAGCNTTHTLAGGGLGSGLLVGAGGFTGGGALGGLGLLFLAPAHDGTEL